jgi:hypothetical protein
MPFRKQLLPLQILPAPQHEPWEYSTPAHRDGDYSPRHDSPIARPGKVLFDRAGQYHLVKFRIKPWRVAISATQWQTTSGLPDTGINVVTDCSR